MNKNAVPNDPRPPTVTSGVRIGSPASTTRGFREAEMTQVANWIADIIDANWNRPYSREEAVFPLPWVAANKFWPSVNRIDDVYGDRNLFCACAPMSDYS